MHIRIFWDEAEKSTKIELLDDMVVQGMTIPKRLHL